VDRIATARVTTRDQVAGGAQDVEVEWVPDDEALDLIKLAERPLSADSSQPMEEELLAALDAQV
jgi:hypothetical protein